MTNLTPCLRLPIPKYKSDGFVLMILRTLPLNSIVMSQPVPTFLIRNCTMKTIQLLGPRSIHIPLQFQRPEMILPNLQRIAGS